MLAIITKYIPATDTRGSRIVASGRIRCRVRRASIPYPHEFSGEDCHRAAVDAWIARHAPAEVVASAQSPTGRGYVFICRPRWSP